MNRIFLALVWCFLCVVIAQADRPNILIAIADDQSYPHTSAYGDPAVQTPSFDRVARAGVLFNQAFTPAPGCSPMRAAFLTGREVWQIREAGTHASSFPTDLPVFTSQLSEAGYHVGMTGKGWSPGKATGWEHNPAGKAYLKQKMKAPKGVSTRDYAANFDDFLAEQAEGQPFCFWFGSHEPHRSYDPGIGKRNGVDPDQVVVPPFLPDNEIVRNDIADYLYEIQWFDQHLGRMLDRLAESGQLDNTIVIVTSDNGMPFPAAKANLYEYGIHMPLAISWPTSISGAQVSDDLVSLIDVTKTIFAAAEVTPQDADRMPGYSLLGRMDGQTTEQEWPRTAVFSGRERHSSSRFNTLGYPCRCIRTATHLYIRNFKPQRWPAGAPAVFKEVAYDDEGNVVHSKSGPDRGGYHDIDAGPTLSVLVEQVDEPEVANKLLLATAKRPAEELYDIRVDPGCLNNLASDSKSAAVKQNLADRLTAYLTATGDLRQTDPQAAEVWETYPRYSPLRWFPQPDWAKGNPPIALPWLEARRPKQ
ncbi:Arylsulfatase [Rubripirellula lacrimiformis]|uniref:Arylsulfatase n=1 Tax=Rubripirellula lacrimiformis TaxID=1930273 RepID=A0A517NI08_9BACT|nr:sulfatase [Rubripirellula lacrimiformis]QDT06708.1 Arylsulfatase [Rubripirellula lacrimiformis]